MDKQTRQTYKQLDVHATKTNWIPEMKFLFNRLESQYTGALERSQIIKDELILERQNNEELK